MRRYVDGRLPIVRMMTGTAEAIAIMNSVTANTLPIVPGPSLQPTFCSVSSITAEAPVGASTGRILFSLKGKVSGVRLSCGNSHLLGL